MSGVTAAIQSAFIKEAIWHGSIKKAEKLLLNYPDLAGTSIHTAAILGDYHNVKTFIEQDATLVNTPAEPFGGSALVYLCMSKYLSQHKRPATDFIKTAKLLLDAGADPNSGFEETGEYPNWESALYGAAGIAQNAELTRLLLERGANPNDNEACYHSPETYDNRAMEEIVETGKLTMENLVMMLIRKHDYHDYEGAKFLLANGANPNFRWGLGFYPLHHALARANSLKLIELLLNYGADVSLQTHGMNVVARAVCEGRGDVLTVMRERGMAFTLTKDLELIAACAEDSSSKIAEIKANGQDTINQVKFSAGKLLARFALNGNAAGIKQLLELGMDVNSLYREGDPYFNVPPGSLPIQIAAWRGYPEVVKVLIQHGAAINQPDLNGETPLTLAVKACIDSYWTYRKSDDSVRALLEAGASVANINYPTGYAPIDELLKQYRGSSVG